MHGHRPIQAGHRPGSRGAQGEGITTPGPLLLQHVRDAIACDAEELPAGERTHAFDYAAILADTPELIDRTEGPHKDPGTAMSYVMAEVITETLRYLEEDDV